MRFPNRLRTRISLLLTAIAAVLLLFGGALWLHGTRNAIHEEIAASSRVAEQWLNVLLRETASPATPESEARLMAHLVSVGRLRANVLEVRDGESAVLYHSPAPTYKLGRVAPAWFGALTAPELPERLFAAGSLRIYLHPDASRAVLDAWDDLCAGSVWALALLAVLFALCRRALDRALAPLSRIDEALTHTAATGRFDRRLPACGVAELDRLGESYNRMVETLSVTRAENRLLESDREFARTLHQRLEEERRHIARELHDELGQAITAVRALSGSIVQRAGEDAGLKQCGEAILSMTGEMQDGVRAILHRLQPPAAQGYRIDEVLSAYCLAWAERHPEIGLSHRIAPLTGGVDDDIALALLRLLQESLTNVARHAGASRAEVSLALDHEGLHLVVADNGRGLQQAAASGRYGLSGMRERVSALCGRFSLEEPAAGGLRVRATLPYQAALAA